MVGVLSFLQIAIQKLGKTWNFGTRSEKHLEVSNGLERLLHKMEFEEKKKCMKKLNVLLKRTPASTVIFIDGKKYLSSVCYPVALQSLSKFGNLSRSLRN